MGHDGPCEAKLGREVGRFLDVIDRDRDDMHGLGIAQEGIEYRNLAYAGRAVRAVEVHQQWSTAKARQAPAYPEVRQGLAGVDEQRGNRKIVLVGIAHCDSLGLAEQEVCIAPRGAARTAILGLEWRLGQTRRWPAACSDDTAASKQHDFTRM